VHRKYIPIYIQQDAKLHSLFISGNCSTCFGWYFQPSSDANTTVSTASGICHTVTAICRYRGRDGTGLSVLWVAYATHSTLKPVRIFYNAHISHSEPVLIIFSSKKNISYFSEYIYFLFCFIFVTIIYFIFALFPKFFLDLYNLKTELVRIS
jgi:hypothetical protein